MNRTPLFQVQLEAGAQFIDFGGWEMPVRFSNELAEHASVRNDCGLFDVSHMGQIWISGADSAAALDFALVTKPSSQQSGQAKYSMICNSAAGIIDDLIVYRISDSEFLIVANASNASTVLAELQNRLAGFSASAHAVTPHRALVALQGPRAATVLAGMGINVDDLGYYRIRAVQFAGDELWIARTGYTGEDGFEISIDSRKSSEFWGRLVAAGATPCGLAARDTLRLEAGMPLYGNELTAETTPFDVGMSRVVNTEKPTPYFAAEALAAARIQRSARRMALPELPADLFIESLRQLIAIDGAWVPDPSDEKTLYIRPFEFAAENFLGVRAANRVEYRVIACPVGPYFAGGIKPVAIWIAYDSARAGKHGTGEAKTGGNYAASLQAQQVAYQNDCSQVLFLDAETGTYIEELGGMNLFFVRSDGSVFTPSLDGTILRGVTRDSILTLLQDRQIAVSERKVSLAEVKQGIESGEIVEIFACGTAAVITPVGVLKSDRDNLVISDNQPGALTVSLREELTGIQYGLVADRHGWMHKLAD